MTERNAEQRLARISKWGQLSSLLALGILLSVMGYYLWLVFAETEQSWIYLADEHNVMDILGPLATGKLVVIATLWSLTDILGIVIFWTAFCMFRQLERGQIFVDETVTALKRMGLCLILIAPITIVTYTINVLLFSFTDPSGSRRISVNVESGEVYALVVGVALVSVAVAMSEALRLARENESFV